MYNLKWYFCFLYMSVWLGIVLTIFSKYFINDSTGTLKFNNVNGDLALHNEGAQ